MTTRPMLGQPQSHMSFACETGIPSGNVSASEDVSATRVTSRGEPREQHGRHVLVASPGSARVKITAVT